jgi:uncharacterized protein involved in exopolysaccharide biosynthesis
MKEILTALFVRKWYAITFFFFVVVGSMTLAYVLPAEYEATGTMVLTAGREKKPFIPSEKDSRTSFMQVSMEDMGSEVEILLSQPVLAKVVDENHLDEDHPPTKDDMTKYYVYHSRKALKNFLLTVGLKTYVPPREQAIIDLAEKIEVEDVKRTNIITIYYRSSVPQLARDVVNSLIGNYINHHIDVFGYSHALEAVTKAKEESQQKLFEQEKAINNLLVAKSISNLENEQAMVLEKLREAENKIRLLISVKMRRADSELGSAEISSIIQDQAFQELSLKHTNAELQRIELISRFGANDRKVSIADQEIVEIKKLIKKMFDNSLSSWESIAEAHRVRLRQLDQAKTEIDPMKRELQNLNQEYLLNNEKYNEIFTSVNLDRAKLTSVKVVQYADVPGSPAFPKKLIILVVSLFFGALGGVSTAFAVNKFSGRIISTGELQNMGDIPVIASIREYSRGERKDQARLRDNLDNDLAQMIKVLLSESAESFNAVIICSLVKNSGTTFITRHLAEKIAQRSNVSTLLVTFHVNPSTQISENNFDAIIAEPASLARLVHQEDALSRPAEPASLTRFVRREGSLACLDINVSPDHIVMRSEQIAGFMNLLKESYGYVFFDMPAQRNNMFYINFVPVVQQLFAIVAYDNANKFQLRFMMDQIEQHHGKISGYVFNRRRNPIPSFLYRRFF